MVQAYDKIRNTWIIKKNKLSIINLILDTSPVSHGTSHTTKSTTTTTTTIPLVPLDCSNQKISVIESIAENLHVEDDRAGLCPGTNKHQTSEALVIHKCNATARSSWSKGVSVSSCLCVVDFFHSCCWFYLLMFSMLLIFFEFLELSLKKKTILWIPLSPLS